ncbi:MAG TPA: two-component system response regulator [Nitrospinae bacterium]|nr:two-component system response regulator [Nitrospinota bacterium]
MARILIVDDEVDVLIFLARELRDQDYEVETAPSGEEAIEKIKANRPHLMLLDINMPGMGGLETLKKAKEIDPHLAVVMVTAVAEEDIAKDAIKMGAYDYIQKPIDLDHLNLVVMTKIVDLTG